MCIIASGCGMDKMGDKNEEDKKTPLERILNKVLRYHDDHYKKELLKEIKKMQLWELGESGITSVKELSGKVVRHGSTLITYETLDMSDYVKKKDLANSGLSYLADILKIRSVQELGGKTIKFGEECYIERSINLDDYVEKKKLKGAMGINELGNLGVDYVANFRNQVIKFNSNCWPEEINLDDYVKKDDLTSRGLKYLANTLKIESVQKLKGQALRFDNDLSTYDVADGYIEKYALQGKSLSELAETFDIESVQKLQYLQTDGYVKLFDENYELTKEAKKLVKEDNYIKKNELKHKTLGELEKLEVVAVKKLSELETNEGVRLFNNDYKLTEEAKDLVRKGKDVNLDNYIEKSQLQAMNLEQLATELKIESVEGLCEGVFAFNNYKPTRVNLGDYIEKDELREKSLYQLAKLGVKSVEQLKDKILKFSGEYYTELPIDLNDYVEKNKLQTMTLWQIATKFGREKELTEEDLHTLGDSYGIKAVKKLNDLQTSEGLKIFDNYVFNEEVERLVKNNVDLSKYIEKEELKDKSLPDLEAYGVKAVEELRGLKIAGAEIFDKSYKLTDEALGLVNQVPVQTAGACCRYQ